MSATLPYLTTPGTIDNAFAKIKAAATPPNFNNDFVQTKLQIKGGSGAPLPPLFKKLGLVGSDGVPTSLYQRLRNPSTFGAAVAAAMKIGYRPLYEVNEYCHDLGDDALKGLVLQVTGLEDGNRAAQAMTGTFLRLKKHANFEASLDEDDETKVEVEEENEKGKKGKGENAKAFSELNLGYTINLNLPPSTNIEVFNAIFKSLKENLLRD